MKLEADVLICVLGLFGAGLPSGSSTSLLLSKNNWVYQNNMT